MNSRRGRSSGARLFGRGLELGRAELLGYVEVAALRAVPGIVNLGATLMLASVLGAGKYGFYSTAIVTASFVANLLFGSISFSLVSQHAKLTLNDDSRTYEASVVAVTLFGALAIILLGVVGSILGLRAAMLLYPTAIYGAFLVAQEVLRASVRVWAFGIAALAQSLVYFLPLLFVRHGFANIGAAVHLFTASYAVGLCVALILLRQPRSLLPDFGLLRQTFKVGTSYTASKLVENGLSVGFRYLLVWFGTPAQLGVFSFALDVAQRVVGFVINVFRFKAVPKAFLADAGNDAREFRRQLFAGAAMSALVAVFACAAVLVVRWTGLVTSLNSALFDTFAFLLVSAAVIVNQLKKTTTDPFAMKMDRTGVIAIGYIPGAVVGLALGFITLGMGWKYGLEISFLAGMVLASVATSMLLKAVR